jgi:SNF2 family DNA or RNA helicase
VTARYESLFKNAGIQYKVINGLVKAEDRQKAVEEFQKPLTEEEKNAKEYCDKGLRIIIISIKAGSTGLTLTQSSTVLFGELWWVPADLI